MLRITSASSWTSAAVSTGCVNGVCNMRMHRNRCRDMRRRHQQLQQLPAPLQYGCQFLTSIASPEAFGSGTMFTVPDPERNSNNNTNVTCVRHAQQKRIAKTLYKELIQWCKNTKMEEKHQYECTESSSPTAGSAISGGLFPFHCIIPPLHMQTPEQLDPYYMELLFATSSFFQHTNDTKNANNYRSYSSQHSTNNNINNINTTDASGKAVSLFDDTLVQKLWQLLPPQTVIHSRNAMTVPIHTTDHIRNTIRLLFRMNSTASEVSPHLVESKDHGKTNNLTKQRITNAFEILKNLNTLTVETLSPMCNKRMRHIADRAKGDVVRYRVGQIVQHRHERWRGVVTQWYLNEPQQPPQPSQELIDDYSILEDSSDLLYEMEMEFSSRSTSPYVDKQHHLHDDIRYDIIVDVNDAYTNSSSLVSCGQALSVSQQDLVLVLDDDLLRVRSRLIEDEFDGFDATLKRYKPNAIKAFVYPTDWTHSEDLNPNSPSKTHSNSSTVKTATEIDSILCHTIDGVHDLCGVFMNKINQVTNDRNPVNTSTSNTINKNPSQNITDIIHPIINRIQKLQLGDVIPSKRKFHPSPVSKLALTVLHLRELLRLSLDLLDLTTQRLRAKAAIRSADIRYSIGDIVQHQLYKYRGVVVGWDLTPRVDVRQWDGVQHMLANSATSHLDPMNLPFYHIIPDRNDCIRIFGSERSIRYVCQENLQQCHTIDQRTNLDIDFDPHNFLHRHTHSNHWYYDPTIGKYEAPADLRFRCGEDVDGDNQVEDILNGLLYIINQWHYEAQRCTLHEHPETLPKKINSFNATTNDNINSNINSNNDTNATLHNKLSLARMMQLLMFVDNVEDATTIQDVIKEIRKGNKNFALRKQLESGTIEMVGRAHSNSVEKAMTIFQSLVEADPTYAEAWNKLATCHYMMLMSPSWRVNVSTLQGLDTSNTTKTAQNLTSSTFQSAMKSTQQALALDPTHQQAYSGLGLLYIEQKEFQLAIDAFRTSIKLDPWSQSASKLSTCIDNVKKT